MVFWPFFPLRCLRICGLCGQKEPGSFGLVIFPRSDACECPGGSRRPGLRSPRPLATARVLTLGHMVPVKVDTMVL